EAYVMKLPFAANLSLDSLSERDRRTLLIGGVVAALLLLYVVFQLDSSVTSTRKRVMKKQADLVWMRNAAPELAADGPGAAPPGPGGQSLLVIVDRSARESGLASALAGSDPAGPGGLSVRLQKASFDALVPWLARLSQQNGIRVDTASIESAGSPGLVNAALVLHSD
ncbi:MAG TPA: type II secretion system protein M, partial [Steroidobacteraceae bacterium]